MSESLFNGRIVAVRAQLDPEDTRAFVVISTEDHGDIRMGQQVTVTADPAEEDEA